ncbi:hypothetical protein Pst134EB_004324 [Puccinia striiformis f. sp. tritici]|nr:hypothetical protein Pst134EB_004324 [Puccinia striiformis f. sp. tritici]
MYELSSPPEFDESDDPLITDQQSNTSLTSSTTDEYSTADESPESVDSSSETEQHLQTELAPSPDQSPSHQASTSWSRQEIKLPPAKPGYDYLLTSDKAPRDINGDIDESQILNYKRRAAIAVAPLRPS